MKILLSLVFIMMPGVAMAGQNQLQCAGIPFDTCVDTDMHEGRLVVPLDWFDRNDPRQIEIKYRIIGYRHTDRPYLFLIGGGPGHPSVGRYFQIEWLRGLGLANHYRLVVFDQRGNGQSSPLKRDSPELTPEIIARYFSMRQITPDFGHLISKLNGLNHNFVMMAHSAGGPVLSSYLANSQMGPRPAAVIYANSITGTNPWSAVTSRFQKQISINHQQMTEKMREGVLQIRARLRQINQNHQVVPEGFLDALFTELYSKQLETKITQLADPSLSEGQFIKMLTSDDVVALISDPVVGTLSTVLFDGHTDLEWAERNNSLVFQEEDWMLLERRLTKSVVRSEWFKQYGGLNQDLDMRLAGRRYAELVKAEDLRNGAKDIPVLALVGDRDQYIDEQSTLAEFRRIFTQPYHRAEVIEGGGHHSSTSIRAAPFIMSQLQDLEQLKAQSLSACEQTLKKGIAP